MGGTLHKAGLGGEVPRAVELRAGVVPRTGAVIMTSDRLRCQVGRGIVVF
jgi:hypothetical protein